MLWLALLRCWTSGIKRKEELCTALSTSHRKQNWDLNNHQIYLYFWINEHRHQWGHRHTYQPPFSKKLRGKTLKPCRLPRWCLFWSLLNLGYAAVRTDTILCHKCNTSTCFWEKETLSTRNTKRLLIKLREDRYKPRVKGWKRTVIISQTSKGCHNSKMRR